MIRGTRADNGATVNVAPAHEEMNRSAQSSTARHLEVDR
jgi:hypothetical protein